MPMEDSRKDKRRSEGGNKAQIKPKNSIFTFHPTKEQREDIRSIPDDVSRDLDSISAVLSNGCTLSLGYDGNRGNYFCLVRKKQEEWATAPAISVFHSQVDQALKGVAYYLREVNEEWPMVLPRIEFNDEW